MPPKCRLRHFEAPCAAGKGAGAGLPHESGERWGQIRPASYGLPSRPSVNQAQCVTRGIHLFYLEKDLAESQEMVILMLALVIKEGTSVSLPVK